MSKLFHILNGDALAACLPLSDLPGKIIVAREALVDGDVQGADLETFFSTRARFIAEEYGGEADYFENVASEFRAVLRIPPGSEAALWFEEDLFCQVNLWFVSHLLNMRGLDGLQVSLVRPPAEHRYGFGGMGASALVTAFQARVDISGQVAGLAGLWTAYQSGDLAALREKSRPLAASFPFLEDAVEAHIDRFPEDGGPGRPERTLMAILDETGDPGFGPVFLEFWRREAVYGFGDTQVRRIYDRLKGLDA